MPFIKPSDRLPFDRWLAACPSFANKGELEYAIYLLLCKYMKGKETCYSLLHDAVYAATHAGEEFKRLVMDPYEDTKREENGDIF